MRNPATRAALTAFLTTTLAVAAVAADGYSTLGLSAAADRYVGEIEVEYGETFTLYVVMTGPDAGPLPFTVDTVDWALLNSCCGGSPAEYDAATLNVDMIHEGEPSFAVSSTAETCVSGDLVVLAEVDFGWLYEPDGPFNLAAAALGPVSDCDGETWLLSGLILRVVPLGITPAETATWGDVKRLFR